MSAHLRSQLINTAEGFIFQVLSLTSMEHMDEIKEIMWRLSLCKMNQKLHNLGNNIVVLTCDPQTKRFYSIHYVAGLSERMKCLNQPWATQIDSRAKSLLKSHVKGQSRDFYNRFSRFFSEITKFQRL